MARRPAYSTTALDNAQLQEHQQHKMKIMVKWLSLLKFTWLRRCKVCRVRGSKCMCKRPSLALEHIFFLEERKNKFGARNFSHVSDTVVTTGSTGTLIGSSNNTVLMRGSSFDEYTFADYYYNPNQSGRGSHGSRGSLDKKTPSNATTTTAIVRKNSGKMVRLNGSGSSSRRNQRFEELPQEGVTLYSDAAASSSTALAASQSSRRRPAARLQNGSSSKNEGCSFKFYGRGGTSSVSTVSSSFGNSMQGGRSMNDSLVLSSSAANTMRYSTSSDRMSVDANIGSYNPRGMFIENGYASIQEDNDDELALAALNGWLQASPTSTAGSFAAPRNVHAF
uniref:Uncharacterized protein n=1 Tax=Globisporangium ultimum (strain ATCC 200006 / CBS 805.95 / DAOM BR144) TaxID=431595 RepID=K3WEG1_GLOUD